MKPAIIISAAAAVLVGFVLLIGAAKDRERQATLDRIDANIAASRRQLTCEHYRATRPDDPDVESACSLVDAVSRSSTPD